jgi:hypothetical protein
MAKGPSRAKKASVVAGKKVKLSMKAIKLHAKENIALLQKADWVEGKAGHKARAISGLKKVLTTMKAVCPSMGLNVTFR